MEAKSSTWKRNLQRPLSLIPGILSTTSSVISRTTNQLWLWHVCSVPSMKEYIRTAQSFLNNREYHTRGSHPRFQKLSTSFCLLWFVMDFLTCTTWKVRCWLRTFEEMFTQQSAGLCIFGFYFRLDKISGFLIILWYTINGRHVCRTCGFNYTIPILAFCFPPPHPSNFWLFMGKSKHLRHN